MRNFILILLLSLFLMSCATETRYGKCIGFADKEDPGVEYELSIWNVAIAVFFSETIIIPLYTGAYDVKCPSGVRNNK